MADAIAVRDINEALNSTLYQVFRRKPSETAIPTKATEPAAAGPSSNPVAKTPTNERDIRLPPKRLVRVCCSTAVAAASTANDVQLQCCIGSGVTVATISEPVVALIAARMTSAM